MGREEISVDRLETLWRQTAAEIRQKEEELQRLQERFRKLDEARTLIQETESGVQPQMPTLRDQPGDVSPTLKNAVLDYIKENAGAEGKSASEVTNALIEHGLGSHVTARVFYSMIYLTLMRLHEAEELRFRKGPRGRLFLPALKTKGLFNLDKELA